MTKHSLVLAILIFLPLIASAQDEKKVHKEWIDKVAQMPLSRITSIEINDGTHECSWSLHEDTINHRLLCGEGEFDPKGFVSEMLQAGYSGPWGIEVLNADLRRKSLDEIVTSSYATTRAQFPA